AALERVDAIDGVGARVAEDDQRHVAIPAPAGLALPQDAADLERRRVGETADEHEVRPLALDQFERLASRVRAEDREAVAGQLPLEELPCSGLRFGQQQRLRRHGAEATAAPPTPPDVLSRESAPSYARRPVRTPTRRPASSTPSQSPHQI